MSHLRGGAARSPAVEANHLAFLHSLALDALDELGRHCLGRLVGFGHSLLLTVEGVIVRIVIIFRISRPP